MQRLIYIIVMIAMLPVSLAAVSVKEISSLAKNKNYDMAIALLQEQLAQEGSSASIYYDLGNLYYKAGNWGAAVLNYSRALRLDPSDAMARNNLMVVQNDVQKLNEVLCGDKNLDPSPASTSAFGTLLDSIVNRGSNFWTVLSLVIFFMAVLAAAGYLFFHGVLLRKCGFFGCGILLLLSIISLICAYVARNRVLSADAGVVMVKEMQLYSAASDDSKLVAAPVCSGTEVRITGYKTNAGDKWAQVFINSDYVGWVPASDIEVITLPGLK